MLVCFHFCVNFVSLYVLHAHVSLTEVICFLVSVLQCPGWQ